MEDNTKISIQKDGNQWCVLWGEDLMNGIAGFGDSIELAMANFALGVCPIPKQNHLNSQQVAIILWDLLKATDKSGVAITTEIDKAITAICSLAIRLDKDRIIEVLNGLEINKTFEEWYEFKYPNIKVKVDFKAAADECIKTIANEIIEGEK
jgi:hypothetical protein